MTTTTTIILKMTKQEHLSKEKNPTQMVEQQQHLEEQPQAMMKMMKRINKCFVIVVLT